MPYANYVANPGTPQHISGPQRVESAAYEASRVMSESPGIVKAVHGYNSGPAQWIQLHDAAALPADTAVPAHIIRVAATSNFVFDIPEDGWPFQNGLVVCNSTTGPTKTIGAANCWFTGILI